MDSTFGFGVVWDFRILGLGFGIWDLKFRV
jgi:hypothetical protein